MGERDAKVRLNLAASGFLTQLQGLRKASEEFEKAIGGIGDGGEKASRKLGAFGSAAKAGFGAAKGAVVELGASIKSAITMVATLGGALSLAGSVKGAVELNKTYKDLAFAIAAGTGEGIGWQAVQKTIEGTAGRWKRSNTEVAESYRMLWEDIGDAKFAEAGVESVAKAAGATGASVRGLSVIVGQLKEKFNIPTAGIDEALASVIALGNKGGASVEDLGEKIGILGASAKEAGYGGADGLQKMLAMLNLADNVTGNFRKSLKSVTGVLDTLGDPEKIKNISKELHLSLVDTKTKKPFAHALEMIIAKSGGKQEILAKVFSGEELRLVTDFGKTYAKAFESTKGDVKTKTAAGLAAYDEALRQAGAKTLSAADIEQTAKERLADTDRQIADAMRRLEIAFTKPELISGLEKLAELAPKLADALANLLGFALEHPKTAVAAVVGGKVAASVIPAVGTSLAVSLIKKIATRGTGSAATKLAAAEGTTAAETGGTTATVAGGGLTAAGGLAVAAGATALAMGSAIGYELSKPKSGLRKRDGTMQGVTDVSKPGTPEDYDRIMAEERRKDAKRAGISEVLNGFRYGGGAAEGVGGGGRNASGAHAKQEVTVDAFVKSLKSGGDASARTAMSLTRAAEAADLLTASMTKLGTPAGTNGLPPNPGDMSGSAPR